MIRDSRLSGVLHVLLHMAERDGPTTSDMLARAMDTNPLVIRRVMAGLRDRGYVQSEKGHGGGWTIACDLGAVTLRTSTKRSAGPNFWPWETAPLPPTFSPMSRDFSNCGHAGSASDCGRYGLIDPQPAPAWRQQPPAVSMPAGGFELGSFLAHMVETMQTGYGREATGVADDWSRTVDELLKVTGASAFNYRRGFKTPQPRGVTAIAFGADPHREPDSASLRTSTPPPSGGRPERIDDGPAEGISILRIGISRHEAPRRAR